LDDKLQGLTNMLAIERVLTKHMCCEGKISYHLFVLFPSGLSFVVAKAIESLFELDFDVLYPSLKHMIDMILKIVAFLNFSVEFLWASNIIEGPDKHGLIL